MAPRRQRQRAHLVHGMTVTELLEASARRWGTFRMEDPPKDDSKGGEGGKPDDDKGAGGAGGGDDEPTAEELAALGDAGLRALERVREKARNATAEAEKLREKASKYDELEEANKTEAQRKDEAAKAAEQRATTAETELAQLKAALDAGLPHTMAARLRGSTPEELKKDAEELKAQLGDTGTQQQRRRRTTSDNDKGGDGPSGGMSSLIRQAAGRSR